MTDRELTPAEEERVRRLLAEARHAEPMPDAVVARLDRVLRELGEESTPAPAATVVSLDAVRRRRRRVTGVLVAAAAVTVLGVGAPGLLRGVGVGVGTSDNAASSAERDTTSYDQSAGGKAAGADESLTPGTVPSAQASGARPEAIKVRKFAFRHDVLRGAPAPTAAYNSQLRSQADSAFAGCTREAAWGRGRIVWATYDGEPGALVYARPLRDRQRVDLYLCGTTQPERSIVIPTP